MTEWERTTLILQAKLESELSSITERTYEIQVALDGIAVLLKENRLLPSVDTAPTEGG